MKLLRTEQYTDSEGDPAVREYLLDDSGQHYVAGPGYFLPCDADGAVELQSREARVRFVNYSATYESER